MTIVVIGGVVLISLLLSTGRPSVSAAPPPANIDITRPDNSWEVHYRGVRGRPLFKIYDPAYSVDEAIAAFRAEFGDREVTCVARRSYSVCDVIKRLPGQ